MVGRQGQCRLGLTAVFRQRATHAADCRAADASGTGSPKLGDGAVGSTAAGLTLAEEQKSRLAGVVLARGFAPDETMLPVSGRHRLYLTHDQTLIAGAA